MNILLGITGGIAAYKTPDIVRRLRDVDANVRVVMTQAAQAFITPLTLQAVSGHEVRTELYDEQAELGMSHIELARWADMILIAPATANCIAKLAQGIADDLLTTVCTASHADLWIAPAMNQQMWLQAATQANIELLTQRGIKIVGPASGSQACGEVGPGRMVEPLEMVEALIQGWANFLLAGKHVIITAGPTREKIDPVRYLSNASSGKMGFALAQAAAMAGANVTLIAGPVNLSTPAKVQRIDVESAADMLAAVKNALTACDIFIGTAAVADYRVNEIAEQKIKKTADNLQLTFIKNPDIIHYVANQDPKPFCVGFALETENLLAYAKQKMQDKKLDMIVANGLAFDADENQVTILWDDQQQALPVMSKYSVANTLIKLIAARIPHATS